MTRTVLTAVEGQRPRHISAVHIACLRGNTDFVKMLLKRGIDVNTTNSKVHVVFNHDRNVFFKNFFVESQNEQE